MTSDYWLEASVGDTSATADRQRTERETRQLKCEWCTETNLHGREHGCQHPNRRSVAQEKRCFCAKEVGSEGLGRPDRSLAEAQT